MFLTLASSLNNEECGLGKITKQKIVDTVEAILSKWQLNGVFSDIFMSGLEFMAVPPNQKPSSSFVH